MDVDGNGREAFGAVNRLNLTDKQLGCQYQSICPLVLCKSDAKRLAPVTFLLKNYSGSIDTETGA